MNNKNVNEILLALFLVSFFSVILIGSFITEKQEKEQGTREWFLKSKCMIEGRMIGRSSMLRYLSETHQIDSVSVDIMRVLSIGDSLQTVIENDNK